MKPIAVGQQVWSTCQPLNGDGPAVPEDVVTVELTVGAWMLRDLFEFCYPDLPEGSFDEQLAEGVAINRREAAV